MEEIKRGKQCYGVLFNEFDIVSLNMVQKMHLNQGNKEYNVDLQPEKLL